MNHSSALTTLLNTLQYNPHAQQKACFVPYGGIYWDDELPAWNDLTALPEDEFYYPFFVLHLRAKLWAKTLFSPEEQKQWRMAQTGFPNWPIFERIHITAEDYQRQIAYQDQSRQFYDAMKGKNDAASLDLDDEEKDTTSS